MISLLHHHTADVLELDRLRPELIKIELNIVELSIPANLVADTDVHDLRVQFILRLTPDSDSRARSVEAVRILTTMSFRPRSASSVWQPSDDTKTHLVPLIICPTVLCVPDTVCTGAITLASVDTDLIVFGADSKLLLMQRISLIESQGLFPARGSAQGSEDLATVTWTVAVPDDALKPRAADGQAPPSAFKPPRKKRMAKTLERALYEADLLEKEQIAQRVEVSGSYSALPSMLTLIHITAALHLRSTLFDVRLWTRPGYLSANGACERAAQTCLRSANLFLFDTLATCPSLRLCSV